jgi:type ISP restriction-modification system protein/N-6 DNA methylase
MNPVETYIRELFDIHRSGQAVKETSYYGPLANLFNEIGKTLKPRVRCIINPKSQGAGIPDGGLYTPDQMQKGSEPEQIISLIPARGVIEIKGTGEDVRRIAKSDQVLRYLDRYGLVLVTNYRDFILVGRNDDNKPVYLETYHLAESEVDFWNAASNPYKMAEERSEQFIEYLKRVMLYAAPLAKPEDVAWFLASYARDAKARIEKVDLPALASIRTALEEALGIKFEGKKGEHFFRSTLVQTLFYGIFSAWVLWSKQQIPANREEHFSWREASWSLHVPMIRALFEQVATPTKLGPLGLVEVLDWTGSVLNRIDRETFFSKFEEEHAVQYFYEPFLEAFDPELRKDLGVWYTPQEIVQYMVARVDTVLREELEIEDGLADPRVYVLDPCCGTGTYLIEVLKRIAAIIQEKGDDALSGYDVKKAALERVFGFEILPAPFVVAHLQLGLLLQHFGTPLTDEKNERVGVYLTNSLTGWEPADPAKENIVQLRLTGMPELKEERDAAEQIKRNTPILVILGNPPYNAFAGVSPKEEQGLIEPYKVGLRSEWDILAGSMHDLYIRFFRLAERRIAEMSGKGIVCYISNHSWVSEPSFVVLRKHLLGSFNRFWIDNMHGDRKISEYAPDGRTSETIFAIPGFSVGIRQGVVISLWAKTGEHVENPQVLYNDDLNAAKAIDRRTQLLESLKATDFDSHYQLVKPKRKNRFSFHPSYAAPDYLEWPRLVDMSSVASFPGMDEDRRFALISDDRDLLLRRMKAYYDDKVTWNAILELHKGFGIDNTNYNGLKVRNRLLKSSSFQEARILPYVFRPFDVRWAYYEPLAGLWHRASPERAKQVWMGNSFLISRPKGKADPEGTCFYITSSLSARDMLIGHGNCIPFRLHLVSSNNNGTIQTDLFSKDNALKNPTIANLSSHARKYLSTLGISDPDSTIEAAELIWMHALAIGYSPGYRTENADGIREDWPRVPLPVRKDSLLISAELGRKVAFLLDTEKPIYGISSGNIRPELRSIATISRVGGGTLNLDTGDLAVTANWGYAGKEGVTMPSKGKIVERDYTSDERDAIKERAEALGLTMEEAIEHLGESTCDIYLNNTAYWKNVPTKVWDYTIGGYQVIKKWLSYREHNLLGRALTVEEAREVMNMARRIAAILLLEPALDENYLAIKSSTYAWPSSESD